MTNSCLGSALVRSQGGHAIPSNVTSFLSSAQNPGALLLGRSLQLLGEGGWVMKVMMKAILLTNATQGR
jgi:hypothetical protein